jgi:hypothetical protein
VIDRGQLRTGLEHEQRDERLPVLDLGRHGPGRTLPQHAANGVTEIRETGPVRVV